MAFYQSHEKSVRSVQGFGINGPTVYITVENNLELLSSQNDRPISKFADDTNLYLFQKIMILVLKLNLTC
jgi:hypothetical protein